jgi:hypothetical protein
MNLAKLQEIVAVAGMNGKKPAESAFGRGLPGASWRRQPDHAFNRKRNRSGREPEASEQHRVDRAEGLAGITQHSAARTLAL